MSCCVVSYKAPLYDLTTCTVQESQGLLHQLCNDEVSRVAIKSVAIHEKIVVDCKATPDLQEGLDTAAASIQAEGAFSCSGNEADAVDKVAISPLAICFMQQMPGLHPVRTGENRCGAK